MLEPRRRRNALLTLLLQSLPLLLAPPVKLGQGTTPPTGNRQGGGRSVGGLLGLVAVLGATTRSTATAAAGAGGANVSVAAAAADADAH